MFDRHAPCCCLGWMHLRRLLPFALMSGLAVLVVLILTRTTPPLALPQSSPPETPAATERSGTLRGVPAGVSATPEVIADIAYPDDLARLPTADQGQSKLWFHDGTWWAILVDSSTGVSRIHRLTDDRRAWVDTGLVVDERVDARADVLWDGTYLYVASGGSHASAANNLRLARYSYDQSVASYVLDSGYPVALTQTGVKRPTIALDGAGFLWVAYVSGDRVLVNHVGGNPPVLGQAFELPGARPVADDDTAAILAYGDRIGVLWSNQLESAVYFASHRDGREPTAWTKPRAVLKGPGSADDHISARALEGPDGPTVFALVKTSGEIVTGHRPGDSQLVLLELRPDGSVGAYQYGRIQDDVTRPLLVIDEEQRVLYMFAVSPVGGGSVTYKQTSADDIRLAPGPGAPFLQVDSRPAITLPTSSKQNVNRDTDLVVLAADEGTSHYVFGVLELDEAP